jgi:thiol:disulfide interchange protein
MNFSYLAIAIAAPFAIAAPAAAADFQDYSPAAFANAQASGRPILIDVAASWCPVCAAQHKVMQKITAGGAQPDLLVLRVDYDTQKPIWKKFGAQKQSTLIAFRGKRETGRMSYDADEDRIRALIATTA